VTVYGQVNYLSQYITNHPGQLDQPSIPPGWINRVSACFARVKAGRVHGATENVGVENVAPECMPSCQCLSRVK